LLRLASLVGRALAIIGRTQVSDHWENSAT